MSSSSSSLPPPPQRTASNPSPPFSLQSVYILQNCKQRKALARRLRNGGFPSGRRPSLQKSPATSVLSRAHPTLRTAPESSGVESRGPAARLSPEKKGQLFPRSESPTAGGQRHCGRAGQRSRRSTPGTDAGGGAWICHARRCFPASTRAGWASWRRLQKLCKDFRRAHKSFRGEGRGKRSPFLLEFYCFKIVEVRPATLHNTHAHRSPPRN